MRSTRRADQLLFRLFILSSLVAGALTSSVTHAEPARATAVDTAVPPLCDAAYRGDLQTVRLLLRKGTAADADVAGSTALMQSLQPFIGPPHLTMGTLQRGSVARQRSETQTSSRSPPCSCQRARMWHSRTETARLHCTRPCWQPVMSMRSWAWFASSSGGGQWWMPRQSTTSRRFSLPYGSDASRLRKSW